MTEKEKGTSIKMIQPKIYENDSEGCVITDPALEDAIFTKKREAPTKVLVEGT